MKSTTAVQMLKLIIIFHPGTQVGIHGNAEDLAPAEVAENALAALEMYPPHVSHYFLYLNNPFNIIRLLIEIR